MEQKPSNRDPRVDPRAGDILRSGGTYDAEYYEVLSHKPRMSYSDVSYFHNGRERALSLRQWIEFVKDMKALWVSK